ncbi:MAG TPA: DUF881 domain-containing protein [Frankiaceae bacterium]|nr:DUF881 domain-containing protein [Frankiaceae bacterium]
MTEQGGGPRREAHPFGSSSLFVDITTITVDPAYVAAAGRRAGDPDAKPPRPSSVIAVTALLFVGSVWGVAAAQTRDRAPAAARIRSSLVDEARRRTEATDRLARDRDRLQADTAAAREAALRDTAAGRALSAEVARLELAAGGRPVSGPGLVVTLDDAEVEGEDGETRVSDADLQSVVNALFAVGAEAVSVNDRRVGALTAIREAGEAILVDYRPVSPPYVVRAVGDPDALDPSFVDSPTAQRLRTYGEAFGLRFDVERAQRLDLPASEASRLRHARPAGSKPQGTP